VGKGGGNRSADLEQDGKVIGWVLTIIILIVAGYAIYKYYI